MSGNAINGPLWTVSALCLCYLLFPSALAWLRAKHEADLLRACVQLACVSMIFMVVVIIYGGLNLAMLVRFSMILFYDVGQYPRIHLTICVFAHLIDIFVVINPLNMRFIHGHVLVWIRFIVGPPSGWCISSLVSWQASRHGAGLI